MKRRLAQKVLEFQLFSKKVKEENQLALSVEQQKNVHLQQQMQLLEAENEQLKQRVRDQAEDIRHLHKANSTHRANELQFVSPTIIIKRECVLYPVWLDIRHENAALSTQLAQLTETKTKLELKNQQQKHVIHQLIASYKQYKEAHQQQNLQQIRNLFFLQQEEAERERERFLPFFSFFLFHTPFF